MDSFKVPHILAQDLLLIQSLVGSKEVIPSPKKAPSPVEDDIDSSGSEPDSEDEIEAELVKAEPEASEPVPQATPSSDDTSSDSDSDSDSSDEEVLPAQAEEEEVMLDDEDPGPSAATASYFTTKNEVVDPSIVFPDIEQVGPDEYLELVGQVMNIIDNTVIIEGLRTELARGGSDRALDADTLLVFEDRNVLGYIYETFGPTTQPMYQIKFNSTTYPLDLEKVRVSRKVYHVPQRSNFVFMQQIQAMKGSDASNMNDEEPADHELEFSDDEAEAEHRRNLKKKRGSSRASSMAPSRQTTPSPSQMRDADMDTESYFMNNNAYDEIGPYDLNYDAPVSRPAPIPYDDPYADEFEAASSSSSRVAPTPPTSNKNDASTAPTSSISDASKLRPQRRSVNRETGRRDDGNRGRGRGRGNSNSNRGNQSRRGGGRGGFIDSSGTSTGSGNPQPWSHGSNASSFTGNEVTPAELQQQQQQFYQQSPISPIGQWPPFQMQNQGMYGVGMPYSPHQQQQQQQQFIQPHINPLFASQFRMGGMGMGPGGSYSGGMPAQPQAIAQGHPEAPPAWSNQWNVQSPGNGEGGSGS